MIPPTSPPPERTVRPDSECNVVMRWQCFAVLRREEAA